MKYVTIINNEQYEIEIDSDGKITVNGEPREVDFLALGESLYSVITEDASLQAVIEENKDKQNVLIGGRMFEAQVLDERALLMAMRKGGLGGGSGELHSPMPGLIVAVNVEVGQLVVTGETVVILESMKMQNELKAMTDGVVTTVNINAGQTVEKDALLVTIEPPEEAE